MNYAVFAESVDGFHDVESWQFIRKGQNSWSLIGIKNDLVVFEIENLHFKQCKDLCNNLNPDAPIVKIGMPNQLVKKNTVAEVLSSCINELAGVNASNKVIKSAQKLLDALVNKH